MPIDNKYHFFQAAFFVLAFFSVFSVVHRQITYQYLDDKIDAIAERLDRNFESSMANKTAIKQMASEIEQVRILQGPLLNPEAPK